MEGMAATTEPVSATGREAWELIFRVAKAKHHVLSARLAELEPTPCGCSTRSARSS
jgi:hypothetical protein